MNTAVAGSPLNRHRVTIRVPYDAADIEKAAQSLGVTVCDEEVTTILENITGTLSDLAASAARAAVLSRVYDDLRRVSYGHEVTDDD